MIAETDSHPIILFDGVCNLCNGFVQFVISHDKTGKFYFGALQSKKGQHLLADFNLSDKLLKTIVLVDGKSAFTESTAVLKIAGQLTGGWKLIYVFIIVPKSLRNWVYKLVAKYRYGIFGKRDACMVPTPELKSRFIDT
jgi:predicted DCC family thiol-disulfide oxidoreductase YuxK